MNLWDIVGYVYNADIYCEDCIAAMFEREDEDAPSIFDGAETILDDEARRRGIDRDDESSYDSNDFPKAILASEVEGDEYCGKCLEKLIDS